MSGKKILTCILSLALISSFYACKKDKNNSELNDSKIITQSNDSLENDENINLKLEVPKFSVNSGFYKDDISLKIYCDFDDYDIYYTVDGSEPNINSTKYEKEITITDRSDEKNIYSNIEGIAPQEFIPKDKVTKATVVKAFAADKNGDRSKLAINTYFVGIDMKKQYNNLAVMSLSLNPDDLFDYEKGIYIQGKVYDEWVEQGGNPSSPETWTFPGNYSQKGVDWERKVHVQFFENDGKLGFEGDMGMRMHGKATRSYSQKSFKLYARKDYGMKDLEYEIIPNNLKQGDDITPVTSYDRIIVRNGGNDNEYTKSRDVFVQSITADRSYSTQAYRPIIVFINGEYWGVYNIREDQNDDFIQTHYDIPKEDVVVIKVGKLEEGNEEDIKFYEDLLAFANDNDLSLKENYDKISEMMDIQSFIDFYCVETYIANIDWMQYHNNYKLWRSRTITETPFQDGKWRWIMYDTDYSLGIYSNGETYDEDTLSHALSIKSGTSEDEKRIILFKNLIKNDEFKKRFTTTFMDITNENFKKENAIEKFDELVKIYRPLMNEQHKRFGPSWLSSWSKDTTAFYDQEVENVKTFLDNRGDYIVKMLTKNLNLSGNTVDVTLKIRNAESGLIKVNTTIPTFREGSWVGKYFTDYPIEISAVEKEGYKFVKWTGAIDSKEPTVKLDLKENIEITAVFEKQ